MCCRVAWNALTGPWLFNLRCSEAKADKIIGAALKLAVRNCVARRWFDLSHLAHRALDPATACQSDSNGAFVTGTQVLQCRRVRVMRQTMRSLVPPHLVRL